MRYNILQLLKNLRYHSHGKEIVDADILNWANKTVRDAGRHSHMESFKVICQKCLVSFVMYPIPVIAFYINLLVYD